MRQKLFALALLALPFIAQAQNHGGDTGSIPEGIARVTRTLRCSMDANAKPWMEFRIEVIGQKANVFYTSKPFLGAEIAAREQALAACQGASFDDKGKSLYIECAGDGDGGYANLTRTANGYDGKFTFPNGGPKGYSDGKSAKIGCRTENP